MIKIITEIDSLNDFNFGGGAVAHWEKIKALGLENDVSTYISECYPEGLTDMELNQFVWFELDEFIKEMEKEQVFVCRHCVFKVDFFSFTI